MGHLINGRWHSASLDTRASGGAFHRGTTGFRNWITPDGSAGPTGSAGFAAEGGRYHLYVSHACPWAHRTMIFRALKGLASLIDVSVVHPDMLDDGWTFGTGFPGATGDRLHGLPFLRDLYTRADPSVSGRVTVPVLWDKVRGTIVSNESAEIIRMFNSAFDGLTGNTVDFWPHALRAAIDAVNDRLYDRLNNGVYRAGFATTQSAYDAAVVPLFATLARLETLLSGRRWLMGDVQTEADWRLFPTLIRFDAVYHQHFKCNHRRLADYKALHAYTRALYQEPGIAATVHPDHFVRHYHYSHGSINPHRIIPIGPVFDFGAADDRVLPGVQQVRTGDRVPA